MRPELIITPKKVLLGIGTVVGVFLMLSLVQSMIGTAFSQPVSKTHRANLLVGKSALDEIELSAEGRNFKLEESVALLKAKISSGQTVRLDCLETRSGQSMFALGDTGSQGGDIYLRADTDFIPAPPSGSANNWSCHLTAGGTTTTWKYVQRDRTEVNFAFILLCAWLLSLGASTLLGFWWLRRRSRQLVKDPRFHCQCINDGKSWGVLQAAPSQLIFWRADDQGEDSDHWEIQAEDLLRVDRRLATVSVHISSGVYKFRSRAVLRPRGKGHIRRLMYCSPLLLAMLIPVGAAVSFLGTLGVILFFAYFMFAFIGGLLIWPLVWVLDLVDARLMTERLNKLSDDWRV